MNGSIEFFNTTYPELGLVMAVVVGMGFGAVLERAGFGRASTLVAQFYLYDMTVFKVIFGAVVTAGLGLGLLSGFGLIDLVPLSEQAISATYIWPMLIAGVVFGVGFIISGYCPGTSMVATVSGSIDGLFTVIGVILGSVIYGELVPTLGSFHTSGNLGSLFLYQLLGLPPVVVAAAIAVIAVAAFIGAEQIERIMTKRVKMDTSHVDEEVRGARRPRRLSFGFFGAAAVVAIVTLLLPARQVAVAEQIPAQTVDATTLARMIFDSPWSLRVIDVRSREDCAARRVPGAECVPAAELDTLGLQYAKGTKTLVVVGDQALVEAPAAARAYRGNVLRLEGGFPAWTAFALETPAPLPADATPEAREEYQFQAAVNAALTGAAAPPPPAPTKAFVAPKKKKEGGCG